MRTWESLGCVLWLLAGCASTPPTLPAPILKERRYSQPAGVVWDAVINSLQGGGITLLTMDQAAGLLTFTQPLSRHEMRMYVLEKPPKYPLFSYFGEGRGLATVTVRALEANRTEVALRSRIEGGLYGRMFAEYVATMSDLTSSGKLERDFFQRLDAALGVQSYPWLQSGVSMRRIGTRR